MKHTDTAALAWRKSSYSGANGNCVEVAVPGPEAIAVRDSRTRRAPRCPSRRTPGPPSSPR
ncbi:DUF397 domain-containing protein [Streptacidiphilus monticola]